MYQFELHHNHSGDNLNVLWSGELFFTAYHTLLASTPGQATDATWLKHHSTGAPH